MALLPVAGCPKEGEPNGAGRSAGDGSGLLAAAPVAPVASLPLAWLLLEAAAVEPAGSSRTMAVVGRNQRRRARGKTDVGVGSDL